MPLPPSLGKSFHAWARPKLRPLVEAHSADKKAGIKRYGSFNKLLLQYSDEFEQQPFAQPDFEEYLDADGEPTMDVITIRERAEQWLRNHTRTSKSVQLFKFEAEGGVSERIPSRARSAAELWAEGQKANIRKATCEYLGIPVTTGNKALPPDYIGARKTVVTREFALLPQEDQDEWTALAREESENAAKDKGSAVSIQERQMGFAAWLDGLISKKTKGGPLGDTFVMQFTGYCVRARDRQLERFRGQIDCGSSPSWFGSKAFKEVVSPAWTEFMHADVEDKVVAPLPRLSADDTGEGLKQARADLTAWFETMFRSCNFNGLDVKAFWRDVANNPDKFVSPDRLPEGVELSNPKHMAEDDFCELYKHIWRCQHKSKTVERDALFMYEDDAVREYVTLERVQHLSRQQERRARKAAARASSSITPTQTEGSALPATVTDRSGPASAPRRDEEDMEGVAPDAVLSAPTASARPEAAAAAAAATLPEDSGPTPAHPAAMQVDEINTNIDAAGANKDASIVPTSQQLSEDAAGPPSGAISSAPTPSPTQPTRDSPAATASPKPRTRLSRVKATAPAKEATKPPATTATKVATGVGKARKAKRPAADSNDEDGEYHSGNATPTQAKSRASKKSRTEPAPKAKAPRQTTRRRAQGTK